jgi:hypothetical protein
VRKVEGIRQVPVRLRHENHSLKTAIEGLRPGGVLRRPINDRRQPVDIPADGLVLNDYLARRLGVAVGDTVWVEVLEGRRAWVQLPVARLVRDHVGLAAYMNLDALNRALGDGDVISGVLLTVEDGQEAAVFHELDRRPGHAGCRLAPGVGGGAVPQHRADDRPVHVDLHPHGRDHQFRRGLQLGAHRAGRARTRTGQPAGAGLHRRRSQPPSCWANWRCWSRCPFR